MSCLIHTRTIFYASLFNIASYLKMTVLIHWLEPQKSIESSLIITTLVGNMIIHRTNHVLTKTEWCLDSLAMPALVMDNQSIKIQAYLNNPIKPLNVNLQKQGTAFSKLVWAEICKIPLGQVLSYSAIALKLDSGARAVANACRNNPFPGIIPCHRVVAVSGLGGYMGETTGKFMTIKKKLLAFELASLNTLK